MDLPAAGVLLPIADGDGDLSWSPGVGIFDGVIDAIWRDFHGRHHAVPLRHAVKRESDLQPDVVGQHFQPADAEYYVGNRADIFAHCVALHSLELLQNVGAHDNRNSPP